MHVNQTARYALHVMMRLASMPEGAPARALDLSKATDAPPAYLSKIMRRLVRKGLLRARKGHGGGFVLARRARSIHLEDVFVAAGGTLEPDVCVFGTGRCDSADPCPLHDSWNELNHAFHSWSRRTTLADLAPLPSGSRRRRRPARRK